MSNKKITNADLIARLLIPHPGGDGVHPQALSCTHLHSIFDVQVVYGYAPHLGIAVVKRSLDAAADYVRKMFGDDTTPQFVRIIPVYSEEYQAPFRAAQDALLRRNNPELFKEIERK